MTRASLIPFILLAVALNAAAQIFLRLGARSAPLFDGDNPAWAWAMVLLRPGVAAGLLCYGVSLVVWIFVLSRAEASFAYPFLGLGFVLVALASWQILGEPLTLQRVAGTALVTLGVLVLAGS